jgi:aminopeptidase N
MKYRRIFKWFVVSPYGLIAIFGIILLVLASVYHRYGFYASGGELSNNQAQYDVIYYQLNLEVNFRNKSIAGYTGILLKPLAGNLNNIELDLIDNYRVSRILFHNDTEVSFKHQNDKLRIKLISNYPTDNLLDFKIFYQGKPPIAIKPPWVGGFNWSTDSLGNDWIGLSCQGEGAKIWFPCKDHQSDKPDSASINITIPEDYFCASNGLLRNVSTPRKGYQTYHWFTQYPISNYNVNISIGKYEQVAIQYFTETRKIMPVIYCVLPYHINKAERMVDMAIDMLQTYRKFYGEYPFVKEKFGLVDTDYLGMEHQTINAYGNNFNFTMVDGLEFDNLMLHEMGHEWWGNKITVRDLADMWIQEGICTYGEALYLQDKLGEDAYHKKMEKIRGAIKNKKPVIVKRNADSHESYHSDIYFKGAYLMHSLRYIMGDPTFFKTLKEFATSSKYTYSNLVSTDDFIELVEQNTNSSIGKFIKYFLYTSELPSVLIKQLSDQNYQVSIPNVEFQLPMDVQTDFETKTILLEKIPVNIVSTYPPVVDEKNWYLKNIRIENLTPN